LPWWAVLLLIVGFVIYTMMTSGQEPAQVTSPQETGQQNNALEQTLSAMTGPQDQQAQEPTVAPRPTRTPAPV
jgi:hypothetical protein